MLDAAFKENERQMKEELMRQSKNEPTEFNNVKYTIQSIDEQIAGYLRQLRSIIFCYIRRRLQEGYFRSGLERLLSLDEKAKRYN